MTNLELENKLQDIANQEENSIEKAVAIEILTYNKTIKYFFLDLQKNGSITKMIYELTHYTTDSFFDTYYEDIIWLKTDFEGSIGTAMKIQHDVKNHLVWFAFEQVAYKMAQEFGLEA